MQKKNHLSRRVLAMFLTIAMLLSVASSLTVFGALQNSGEPDGSTNDGEIVAKNYELTEKEKALLNSGYLVGSTYNYHVPNASDELISIDTDHKTITAKSFEETDGYRWDPVSVEVVVNQVAGDPINFEGGNTVAYDTDATAFSVRVKYEVKRTLDEEIQTLLLNAPAYLKEGVAQLDEILDPKGKIISAINSFVMFSSQNLPKGGKHPVTGEDLNPYAETKNALRLLLENGYSYETGFAVAPLASCKFFEEIKAPDEGMKYSEADAARALLAQMDANNGKLNLSVISEEYANAPSKVEFLINNAERIQNEIQNTYDYFYAFTHEQGTFNGALGLLALSGIETDIGTLLETYFSSIRALAGDKKLVDTNNDGVEELGLKYDELGVPYVSLLEDYCSVDAWQTIGKDIVRNDLDANEYLALDALVIGLGDDLKGASAIVKNPVVYDSTVIQFNMSMYDVDIKVTLKVTEDKVNSKELVVYDFKTTTLTLAQNITKDQIFAAISADTVEADALAAWADVFVSEQFDRAVAEELPDTLTEDISYNIVYTPKNHNATFDYADDTKLPYGYRLQLPVHADSAKAYDYLVNDTTYYPQGSEIKITGDIKVTRTEGKSYTPYTVNQIVAENFFKSSAKASAILNSGALSVGDTAVNVRMPEASDPLVNLKGAKLTASDYASSYENLTWKPYSYTVVSGNDSETYLFNGVNEVTISEANYDRVDVTYRLSLTNIDGIQDLLDLPAALVSDAKDQNAALNRLNGYYDQMGLMSGTMLETLKSFVDDTNAAEASKTNLKNAIDAILNDCVKNNELIIYTLLTEYQKYEGYGLAYYYENSTAFIDAINTLSGHLTGVVSEEALLTEIAEKYGYGEFVDKIAKLEGAMKELKDDLKAPNEAIDTKSGSKLRNLVDAFNMEGNIPSVTGDTIYLTSETFTKDADNKVTLSVKVQNAELPRVTFTIGHELTEGDIKAITDAISEKLTSMGFNEKYYTTTYDASVFTSLIGKKVEELEKTDFSVTYDAKKFTVNIEDATGAIVGVESVSIEDLSVELPASNSLIERYDYIVFGATKSAGTYTFTSEQFEMIVANGGCTVERKVINIQEEKYRNFVNGLNEAIGSDKIVFALTKNGTEYAVIMKMDASAPEAMFGAVQALAQELMLNYYYVSFKEIGVEENELEENAFIKMSDSGPKVYLQALIDTILNSGFSSNTIIGMMDANGAINNMAITGSVISDKKIDAAGALLAQTKFRYGESKENANELNMYITVGEMPSHMLELRNLLANEIAPYFSFNCAGGKAMLNFKMPQKAYEAYLALLLATNNVDITDVNAINEDVALGFLENVIRPLMMSDASATSVQNTLAKFGYNINFAQYEQAFEAIRNFYKGSTFAYDGLDSSYGTHVNISIAKYIESMNLGDLGNVIAEKNTGINVEIGASLVNLDKNYEALYFDIGAAGITKKFGLVEDIAATLNNMKGTAVVLLLSDVEGDLTFKTATVLNLNGFTVNGNIVGQGSVRVVDSLIDDGVCGTVTGTVSGNVMLAGGKYTQNVSAFIPEGYEQNADGVVSNKFMTIVKYGDDKITVKLNAGAFDTRDIPDVKTLAVDILIELLLNGYSANKLYFGDEMYKLYELTVDDLIGLYASVNRKDALMKQIMSMVNGADLVAVLNTLLEDITDFSGMRDTLASDLENGTESALFSYKLTKGTWGISFTYEEDEDYISADITSGEDKDCALSIVLSGTDSEKQRVLELLNLLADTTKADVKVTATVGKQEATFVLNAGVKADVQIDLSKDPKYAIIFSVIVADGIGAPANSELVAGLKDYFENDDMTALTLAFNKLTLKQLVTTVENFNRNDTFTSMMNSLGLGEYEIISNSLEADLNAFAKLLGILARRVDVTGPSIAMGSSLDSETYAYTLDKEHIKKSFELNLVAGYSALLNLDLVDVFASVKLFNAPDIPTPEEIDYSELEAKIAEIDAENLVESEYTEATWAVFKSALDAAKALATNKTAETQAEVDQMRDDLTEAREALVKKTPPVVPTIDYTALKAEIAKAKTLLESEYTAESWAAYMRVLDDAKALLNNASSQTEVSRMRTTLMAARNALVKKTPVVTPIDYTALEAKIAEIKAENLVESEYTEATWAVFKSALDAAKALATNKTAETQAEVDQMRDDLTEAREALVKKTPVVTPIDYTALKAKIAEIEAENLVESEYTEATWAVFKSALDDAKALVSNQNAETQAEVDQMRDDLAAAREALVKKTPVVTPIDYTALKAKIAEIEGKNLVEADYTMESWSAFKREFDEAKALIDNATSQKQIDDALAELTAAYNGLTKKTPPVVPTIDYGALKAEIAKIEAENLAAGDYTAESWAVFKSVLDSAKALADNESASTQKDVDDALVALKTARDALVKKTVTTVEIDYSVLKAAIAKAEALNEKDYKADSWKALTEALDAAKKALDSKDQKAVDDAAKALNDAIDALEEKANLLWLWITIPTVVVVGAAAAFVFIFLQKKKKITDSTPLVDYNIGDDDN